MIIDPLFKCLAEPIAYPSPTPYRTQYQRAKDLLRVLVYYPQ